MHKSIVLLVIFLLSGCSTTTTLIDDFCILYEPVRNYLESPDLVVYQIDVNNAVYLERCYD